MFFVRIVTLLLIMILWMFLSKAIKASSFVSFHWHPANTNLPTNNIETLAAAQLSSTILYAGTWEQDIYRSTDHGATWQPANTGITLPLRVQGGLAVNPVTPTILYAGDYYGNGGLYRSENGGISWTLSLPGAAVRAVAVYPLTPTTVLLGDGVRGLYRSVDDGASWSPITATAGFTATGVRELAFAPSAPNIVYVGATNTLFSSNDNGQTWGVVSRLPSGIQALTVHPVTPTLIYLGTLAHGLNRSVNGGVTWTVLDNGIPADAWVTSIAINPISPTITYAGTWNGRVYQSEDGGESWQDLGYLGYVYDILIHPTDPSVIYAATSNNGVFRGSSLDHLTIDEIASPQYVNHSFPITLTARDALGFPLTGATQAQLRALHGKDTRIAATLAAGGYAGAATLTDATHTLTPTTVNLVDGVATANVTIAEPHTADTITATLADGPNVASNPFDVLYAPITQFIVAPIPDQITHRPFTITITAYDAMSLTVPYTGTVLLSDTTGTLVLTEPGPCTDTLTLRCAGPFEAGVWSGQVTIAQPHPAVTIEASGSKATGAGNPFAVRQQVYLPLVLREG